jgi:hypothetical protein
MLHISSKNRAARNLERAARKVTASAVAWGAARGPYRLRQRFNKDKRKKQINLSGK